MIQSQHQAYPALESAVDDDTSLPEHSNVTSSSLSTKVPLPEQHGGECKSKIKKKKIKPTSEKLENDIKPPGLSYIALISMAIQSAPEQRMLLSEIYTWIAERHSYYQMKDKSWRNSIRHNLSLNECFVKNGRSENGKGNYWSIHPANIEDFAKGDYRRRRARRRVRKCDEDLQRLCSNSPDHELQPRSPTVNHYDGYVPMVSTLVPSNFLSALGVDPTRSRDEWMSGHYPYQNMSTDYKYRDQNYYYPSFNRPSCGIIQPSTTYLNNPNHGDNPVTHTQPKESTFNVNVNVNVCGNTGSPSQHVTPHIGPSYPPYSPPSYSQKCPSSTWQPETGTNFVQ